MSPLSARERAIRQRLKDDFAHYAPRCLRIRTKTAELADDGGLPKFHLNAVQRYVHSRLEAQRRETGKVRALVLKGRQMGLTTYVEGRFYWRASHRRGVRAYILTHEQDATNNIFDMAKTYHDNCPPLVRPKTGASNAKELVFSALGSGYKVGTAGSRATGRSSTVQYFHGSEVAFWPNADKHVAGVLQAVPEEPGTEVILESTSDGPRGKFYDMCKAAMEGRGEYVLIFVPWFWDPTYAKPLPEGFELTSEEEKYKGKYELTDEQIYWRRCKIDGGLGADDFRREYPADPEEAFRVAAKGALWTPKLIEASRVPKLPRDSLGNQITPLRIVVAVDPSGGDGPDNDEAGVVVGGLWPNKHVYVWRDASGKLSPNGWGSKACALYHKYQADRVVAEVNFGADMVRETVEHIDPTVAFKALHASRGKRVRAEPVKAAYERGEVHHVGSLLALEDEMTTWEPEESSWSPNRLDAMVWLVHELLLQTGTWREDDM